MEEVKKQQVPRIETFKGNPVIVLNPEDKYVFSFGLSKAKLILKNLDAIKSFVSSHDQPPGSNEA